MNKVTLLLALAGEKLYAWRQRRKVGKLGLWEAGEVMDVGDEFVAYITVNGKKSAVLVRCTSRKAAIDRRKLIIDTMMGASRAEATEAVQLIALTQGDKTIEVSKAQ